MIRERHMLIAGIGAALAVAGIAAGEPIRQQRAPVESPRKARPPDPTYPPPTDADTRQVRRAKARAQAKGRIWR